MEKTHKIYIMLTKTGTVLSRLINLYTQKPYSHVSISLDSSMDRIYSFGRYKPTNPIFAGFIREDILNNNGTYSRFPNTKCALYSLEISEDQYSRLINEVEKFIKGNRQYKYNLIGLLGVMLNTPLGRENNYFCSQFVSEVLNNSGVRIINKETGLTTPDDFRACGKLQLEYEGYLKNYAREYSLMR